VVDLKYYVATVKFCMIKYECNLSFIENIVMIGYLMYHNKLNKMEDKRLPKISSNSNQNHLQFKWGWNKDGQYWLNHWGIKEEIIMQNKDNIRNIITSKFKEKLWRYKELERKRKL
jgi:hypothetical protein